MPLSWNEIRHNAIRFTKEWTGETREEAEAKSFWDEFFQVFGLRRRTVATFEEPVKKISGDYGYIDLFWSGVLLVEHKSFGKDLGKAESQAFRYIQDLAREGRQNEIPRYVIVSDFARVALHDLEPEEQKGLPLFDKIRVATTEFPLAEFHKRVHAFAFIPGYKQHSFKEEDPINIEAAEILGDLHDALEAGGYRGHDLERFLVRILFCLFAEDTGIYERESFHLYLENRTAPDGSDLGLHLARLFEVLDTPPDQRQKNLDETLAAFPYVNGELFNEHLGFADFNRDMRNALLACTRKDWSRISPAIFGSLFQSIMEPKERRQIGAHYTSERDILKVVRSLFLDNLRAEFENRKADRSTGRVTRLEEFHRKLCNLRFFDPACGCGNFLVITYRELRQLELETLKEIFGKQTELTLAEINRLSQVDVDQFYGIEIGEWPSRIADLYDPLAMPAALVKAHTELDRAVDLCYRNQPFESDRQRVEFLFTLYEKLTAPLVAMAAKKPKRNRAGRPQPQFAEPPPAATEPGLTPEKAYGDAAHFYGKEESPPYKTGSPAHDDETNPEN